MNRRAFLADSVKTAASAYVGVAGASLMARGADPFELKLLRREPDTGRPVVFQQSIQPAKTAIVVIDMWDCHWCKTYTARVANLVPRMNQTLEAARKLGITIVFAPSDVVGFYQDYPQRKAMQAIPPKAEPATRDFPLPPDTLGQDGCECGPSQPCKTKPFGSWRRQHPDLRIADGDLIGDGNNARELLNFCQERGVDTLIYVGVASNMCVRQRAFGMINMKRHGYRTIFISDLVEAITANGLDPAKKTPDWNFTPAKGSALSRAYNERYLAASCESRHLIAAAGLSAADRRTSIVFVIVDQEYKSDETLPAFAKTFLTPDYRCTFLLPRGGKGPGCIDIPGLEALYDADLLVMSMRRCALPVAQMDFLERYIRCGKPIVNTRINIVPFQLDPKSRQDGYVIWPAFDQEVLGCHYQGYNAESRKTGSDVWVLPEASQHPIVQGLENAKWHSPIWLYRQNPLAPSVTVLMRGQWSPDQEPGVQPVAWTHTYEGGRVFYTALGHWDDFRNEKFNRLLLNGIKWVMG